jgi:subtilase-type serine protease
VCLALVIGSAARGDDFTVTSTADDGEGSLRQAIEDANAMAGDDTILFELASGSTIQLDTALPSVMDNLIIDGSDAAGLTVRGADGMSFLTVDGAEQLALVNLGLANGQVTVSDNAELRLIDGSFDVGTLDVAGNGTVTVITETLQPVTLTGSDTSAFLGQLVFQEGTLNVDAASLPTNMSIVNEGNFNNDSIVFVQGSVGTFSGQIVGPMDVANGSVNKTGSGNLMVDGTIRADVLQILDGPATFSNSTIFEGQLRIGVGAVLQGESQMGSITQGGKAPGNSLIAGTISPGVGVGGVGTLNTDLDLDFLSTGVLQIDVTGGGADQLTADQVVVASGARLDIRLQGSPMGTEKILSATNISGDFDFQDDFFFFTVTVDQTANDAITVDVSPSGKTFTDDGASTSNQRAIAMVLDDNAGDPGLQADLFDKVGNITEAEIPALLDSLTGESLVAFTNARLAAKSRLDNVIESRAVGFAAQHPGLVRQATRDPLTGGGGPASLPLAGFSAGPRSGYYAFAPEAGDLGLGGWLDGHAVLGTLSGSGGAADVDYRVYGTSLGLDYRISQNFLVGAATGYSRLEPELSGRPEEGTGNVVHGALFGAAVWKLLHAAGWARYAWGDYETTRRIGFGVNRTAKGSFNGSDLSGHGEIAVRTPKLGGTVIEPFGSFDYTRLDQDGFTESGAGTLNLTVPSEDWTSLVSGVGARVHHVFELEPGMWFVPQLHGRWLHEFGDTERRLTPSLGIPGSSFGPIVAAEPGRDSVVGGIRWSVNSDTGVHVFGDYEVGWNPDFLQHAVRAGFQLLF